MSDNLVNDVKRLERVGNELSGTNQKLLAAATRILDLIFEIVPEDIEPHLGFGYEFFPARMADMGAQFLPHLMKLQKSEDWLSDLVLGNSRQHHKFHKGRPPTVTEAHVFAEDVANGFLARLCKKLEAYHARSTGQLTALEQGEDLLRKKFS